jgi:hypothetical protein
MVKYYNIEGLNELLPSKLGFEGELQVLQKLSEIGI